MCVSLSKALPEFPPLEGEDKPLTFRRVLLNTCQARKRLPRVALDCKTQPGLPQEEFEGAALARTALESISDAQEREAAERKVKLRTMGNIRLIGELYKTKMIAEKILNRRAAAAGPLWYRSVYERLACAAVSGTCWVSTRRTRLMRMWKR
jgi:translation initiation factor 4G